MLSKNKHTQLIILIDPDKYNPKLIDLINHSNVTYIFVGGSKLKSSSSLAKTIKSIKSKTNVPVIIFPGDEHQISKQADGILMLSLISGRNSDYLIGKHVKVARKIKASKLTCIPTGYILVDGGKKSTTQKVTKTIALKTKKDIIDTAIAGELIGNKLIYLEAGSGAQKTLSADVIKSVKKNISLPLIIGGGINSVEKAKKIIETNPDYLVVGNALEENPELLIALNKLFKN